MTPEQTDQAVRAVEGIWWSDGKPRKRQLDIGLKTGEVVPWLVRGLPFTGDSPALPFKLPQFTNVRGRDFSNLMEVQIDPRILEADRICQCLPGSPRQIREQTDLPILMQVVRSQLREQFGSTFAEPWTPDRTRVAAIHSDRSE